jgi:hypothetical protein
MRPGYLRAQPVQFLLVHGEPKLAIICKGSDGVHTLHQLLGLVAILGGHHTAHCNSGKRTHPCTSGGEYQAEGETAGTETDVASSRCGGFTRHTATAASEQAHVHLEVSIRQRGKQRGLKQMLQAADVVGSLHIISPLPYGRCSIQQVN